MVNKHITLREEIGLKDSIAAKGRTDMSDIYIKEAKRRVIKSRESFNISISKEGKERNDALWNEKQNSLFTIMFSVFALEAHINKIGHDGLTSDVWEDNKRRLIRDKWYDFPNLISGKSFDKTKQLWKDFDKIVILRNKLVHFKDYDFKEFVQHPSGVRVVGLYEIVNVENAELAYNTATDMIKELDNLLKKEGGYR